jgi:hypothetical protein
MAALRLTRFGRFAFTIVSIVGLGLILGDALLPRPGAEQSEGPNAAGVVGGMVLFALGAVFLADLGFRVLRKHFWKRGRGY